MRKTLLCLLAFAGLMARAQELSLIPLPQSVLKPATPGYFKLTDKTQIVLEGSGLENSAAFLKDYLQKYYNLTPALPAKATGDDVIRLNFEKLDGKYPGAYHLSVDKKGIYIAGDNEEGVFYGVQTLLQLIPVEYNGSTGQKILNVPFVSISDEPRFAYRGMHFDVSRHFFSVDYVKKYIDYLALHKFNYFHWHLTDDQGWRIEIKKYPRLTSVGGWRNGTIIGRYPGVGNDSLHYGGFYTQEEIKEVVAYAAKRYITIIPEIEMPGHSMAALEAYPELGTDPKYGYSVSQTWGINDVYNNVLNPSEYTFGFLEDVLTEVMALFPAPYIHIGGDECSKIWWHQSAFCQNLMKEKGIPDEHGLQSYFIQRIEKFVNSKGKKIIGWDEILEGGLAPNATVMSWRGEQGGIDAARQNHDVIMTPGNPVYFDHSQSLNEDSVTIGGYNPVEKVYAYEPVPAVLNAEQAKHVLGAQANVWTEYIGNPRKVEYMIFPRMAALSEVLWTDKSKKDSASFFRRLETQFRRYDRWGANYSKAWYDLKSSVVPAPDHKGVLWKIESKRAGDKIEYATGDFKTWKPYTKPVPVTGNFVAQSRIVSSANNMPVSSVKIQFSGSTGKEIILTNPPSPSYPGDGAFTLVNGIINEKGMGRSSEFIGFSGQDCEAIIDMGDLKQVSFITVHALNRKSSWIWKPQQAQAWISADKKTWVPLAQSNNFETAPESKEKVMTTLAFRATFGRYVKVLISNAGKIPEGNPGAGKNAWLFVDEITVDGPVSGGLK